MRRFTVTSNPRTETRTFKEDTPYSAYLHMVSTMPGFTALPEIRYSSAYLWRGEAINNDTQMGAVIWIKELV